MRKFCVYVLTPLVTACIGLLKIPAIENYLDSKFTNGSSFVAGGLVILSLSLYYLTIFSPFRALQKKQTTTWKILSAYLEALMAQYQQYHLTFNIMIPRFSFIHRIEPKSQGDVKDDRKWVFFGKVFEPIWAYPRTLQNGFKLTVNQGIAGKAFREGQDNLCFVHFRGQTHPGTKDFKLNRKQLCQTENIIVVGSIAINTIQPTERGHKKKTQGVLSVESNHQNSLRLFDGDQKKLEAFSETCLKLANICGMLLED